MFGTSQFGKTQFGASASAAGETVTLSGFATVSSIEVVATRSGRHLSALIMDQAVQSGRTSINTNLGSQNRTTTTDRGILQRQVLPSAQVLMTVRQRGTLQRSTFPVSQVLPSSISTAAIRPLRSAAGTTLASGKSRSTMIRTGMIALSGIEAIRTESSVEVFLAVASTSRQSIFARLTLAGLQLSAFNRQGIRAAGKSVQRKGMILTDAVNLRSVGTVRKEGLLISDVRIVGDGSAAPVRTASCAGMTTGTEQTAVRIRQILVIGSLELEASNTTAAVLKGLHLSSELQQESAATITLHFLQALIGRDRQDISISGLLNRPTTLAGTDLQLGSIFSRFAVVPDTSNDRLVVIFSESRRVIVPKQNQL